jgi:hypothetical protein
MNFITPGDFVPGDLVKCNFPPIIDCAIVIKVIKDHSSKIDSYVVLTNIGEIETVYHWHLKHLNH